MMVHVERRGSDDEPVQICTTVFHMKGVFPHQGLWTPWPTVWMIWTRGQEAYP